MINQKNTINPLQNNSDKNLTNLADISQKNQDLIAKEIILSDEEKTQKSYIKIFEKIEKIAETIRNGIKNDNNTSEKTKSIILHDISSIQNSSEGIISIISSCNKEQLDEMIKKLEKRMVDIEKSITEHYQIHDNIKPTLYPIDTQEALEETKDILSLNDIYRDYIIKANITFKIDTHQKINFCIGAIYDIFHNLMKNAIKAIAEQKDTIKEDNREIDISIKDNKIYFHNYGVIPERLQNQTLFDLGTTTTGT
ncbi:TPA: hypothetical protein DCZ39_02595 [Patescibacteria group bacterium]|nr:hypothetical protein [Candidatus Gracilibacteria bacterium]